MQAQIKLKLKKLSDEKAIIEREFEKWKSVSDNINMIENEIILLQKEIISLGFGSERRENISEKIQLLNNKQMDLYWNAQSNREKLESRKLNFMTFRKQPKFHNETYKFETVLNHYTEMLIEINEYNKKIWWDGFNSTNRDRYLKVIQQELQGVLKKRDEVKLLDKSIITKMLEVLSREAYRNRYANEEWLNLIEVKRLFEEVHLVKRDKVYFF